MPVSPAAAVAGVARGLSCVSKPAALSGLPPHLPLKLPRPPAKRTGDGSMCLPFQNQIRRNHFNANTGDGSPCSPQNAEDWSHMLVHPYKKCTLDLMEELHCEMSSVYRLRARAIEKLLHLRYGAGAGD